ARKLKIRSAERTVQSLEKKLQALKDDYLYVTRPEAQAHAVRLVNQISDWEHRYGIAGTFSFLLQSLIRVKTREQYAHFAGELQEFFKTLFPLEHRMFRNRMLAIWKKPR
ncbi:MAG TPA: hypothetical protein VJK29_09210, partial [Terriglobales bacterium]|nr:hypothetical protein [Terriglobales bacterium]